MADIREYKCPACGGAMEFDSKTQKMKCPYCDTVADLSDFEETQSEKTASKEGAEQGETQEAAEEGAMMLYVCESCGGEILADKTTGATSCPYCGNKVVMKGQFDGALRPDYIIPFKKDKKQAKEAYRKHLEGKKFLPGVFKQQNHIDEIKGVYVPFWIFDLKAKADFSYHAEKTRVWVSNDIEYTEHENFEVKRAGTVEFEKVPADGSKKMDDTLMESVEPYDFKEAVPFRMAYMAGYLADRYDVPKEECIGRAKKRIQRSTEREFRNTVKGYHVIDQEKANMEIKDQAKYALYPVWILNTTWKGKKYIFAMNGQTGRLVGELPCSKPKLAIASVLFFVIGFILSQILFMGEYAYDPDYLTFDIEGILINIIAPLIIVIIGDVLLVGQLKTANEATCADEYCGELDLTEKHDTFSHTETSVVMKDDKDD